MLNTHSFKRAVQEDIESLEQLDFDLKPSKKIGTEFKSVRWRVLLVIWIASMLPIAMACMKDFGYLKNNIGIVLTHTLVVGVVNAVLTFILVAFMLTTLYNYVYFNQKIKDKLKLGGVINQMIRKSAWLAYISFISVLMLATDIISLSNFIAWPLALLPALIIAKIFISVENKRLGIDKLMQNIKQSIAIRNNLKALKVMPIFT
tara:strand:+ start:4743 stop:5354 length:612 start_codon:yes stop_codon:yes gene_type:complete